MKPTIFFTTETQRAQSNDPSAPSTALASPACGWSRLAKANPRQSIDKKFGLVLRALRAFVVSLLIATAVHAQTDFLNLQNTTVTAATTQSANVTITASNNYIINTGGSATFSSGISIILNPGVHIYPASSGTAFHAFIDSNKNNISDWIEEQSGTNPPYFTSFESADGFSLGNINAQNAWYSGPATVSLVNTAASDGLWSVDIPASNPTSSLSRFFKPMSGQSITYVDFYMKPTFTTSIDLSSMINLSSTFVGFLQTSGSGQVQMLSGSGSWIAVGPSISLTSAGQAQAWQRITAVLNYGANTWSLYLNNTAIANNQAFFDTAETYLPYIAIFGGTNTDTMVDDFYIGSDNPLPAGSSPLTPPASLSVSSTTPSTVTIYWAPATGANPITGYHVYRNGLMIGTTSGSATYFTDSNLSAGTGYNYYVEGFDAASDTSGYSVRTTATTATPNTLNLEIFPPIK